MLTPQLEKPCAFSALSYAWGNGPSNTVIFVNGCEFKVSEELARALRHLRKYHEDKEVQNIWIDAISINQDDYGEKNAQIPLMKDIYQSAHEVIVWLGEADPVFTSYVIDMLERKVQFNGSGEVILRGPMEAITTEQWLSFGTHLMKRPWWWRMWVIQEIAVAREAVVMCGQYTVGWKKLEAAGFWAQIADKPAYLYAKKDGYLPNVRWKRAYRIKLQAGLPMPILELLQNNVSCCAKDDRDMVFPLIGLATDIEFDVVPKGATSDHLWFLRLYKPPFNIFNALSTKRLPWRRLDPNSKVRLTCDYRQSVQQLYIDLVHVHANTHTSLNAICLSKHPKRLNRLPSWVPDWTSISKTSSFLLCPIGSNEPFPPEIADQVPVRYIYNASVGLKPDFHFCGNDELHVSAICFDTLERVGTPFIDRHILGEIFYMTLFRWMVLAQVDSSKEVEPYVAGGSKMDAYRRTITADQTRYGFRWKQDESTFDPRLCVDSSGFRPMEQRKWAMDKSFRDDERAIYLRIGLRTFFVTKKGYFGIGPPDAKEDDRVCILSGCSVPVLLRKNRGRIGGLASETWFFVGECFVLGIMDGEAVQMGQLEKLVLK
jgi:hypothetical protein